MRRRLTRTLADRVACQIDGMITKLDFVAIPSQDGKRSRRFYGETLGLRPDDHGQFEYWAGETCLGIWEPERLGMAFAPQKNGHLALHVDDVAAARTDLEAKGVTFAGGFLGVSRAAWPDPGWPGVRDRPGCQAPRSAPRGR